MNASSSRHARVPAAATGELRRLQALLPADVRDVVELSASSRFQAEPIRGVSFAGDRVRFAIDLHQWERLPREGQDLLLWHQVARVRSESLQTTGGWEKTALLFGLGSGFGELWLRDPILFGIILAVSSVAGYRLYRRSHLARSGRSAFAADRDAISLATQFGYPESVARRSLIDALEWLCQRSPQAAEGDRYRARLQALKSPDFGLNSLKSSRNSPTSLGG
ncbi:MAG: DUF3318 domain-containing protein [Cyanobacteria bacterium J06639_1]